MFRFKKPKKKKFSSLLLSVTRELLVVSRITMSISIGVLVIKPDFKQTLSVDAKTTVSDLLLESRTAAKLAESKTYLPQLVVLGNHP